MKVYISVDTQGNVVDSLFGEFVVPDREYDYVFYDVNIPTENISKCRVTIKNGKPALTTSK